MNKKSLFAVLLLLLLAAGAVLGLPLMAREIEKKAEALTVTATSDPSYVQYQRALPNEPTPAASVQ